MSQWTEQVEAQRAAKDRFFRESPDSPAYGTDFHGLRHYPPDRDYLKVVPLQEEDPQDLTIPRTGGDEVTYTRVGVFELELPVGTVRLAAYSSAAHGDQLWVPFRDATSGPETYGAGRYLEARPVPDGRYVVDLNMAYHPYCAYNEAFTCPMVPFENHLQVPIRAGERL